MGDNGNQEALKALKEPIKLLITLFPDGRVNVAGPIKDRMLCYGLLEMAKETIYNYNCAKKAEIPKHGILDFARRK